MRYPVMFGEFRLGFVVQEEDGWHAKPHHHSLYDVLPGEPTQTTFAYGSPEAALGFFKHSVPEACRLHLKLVR